MNVPFTKVSLILFFLYFLTNDSIIGGLALNCNFSCMIGFESSRLLFKKHFNRLFSYYDVDYRIFNIFDFIIHVLPSLILLNLYSYLYISFYFHFLTFFLNIMWGIFSARGFNLNKVYGLNMTLDQWHIVWFMMYLGHLTPLVIKTHISMYNF